MTFENNEDLPKPILIEDLGTTYPTEKSKERKRFGIYKCGFCGNKFKACIYDVNRGNTKSCGCYKKRRIKESNEIHGLVGHKLYRIWSKIKDRILNPKNKDYNTYGGRGIIICGDWKNDFKAFYYWAMLNGYEENKGLSIDRIDNNGNYEPSNCRWTTQTIQCRNQRLRKDNKSGYKGVNYHKSTGKYQASVNTGKKQVYLGLYPTAVEGAIAYNNYIIENNLEGFILNEIPQKHLEKEITNEKIN